MPRETAEQVRLIIRDLSEPRLCERLVIGRHTAGLGIGVLDRVSAVLFQPQPEPPGDERMEAGFS